MPQKKDEDSYKSDTTQAFEDYDWPESPDVPDVPSHVSTSKKSSSIKVKTMRCGSYRKTKPPPGCAKVEGCIWIPKIGCLPNDPERIKKELTKKKLKQLPDKPKKSNTCKTFKKTKPPICTRQSGCKWVDKQGKKTGYCDNI